MSKSYQPWAQDQTSLLPPSLREWLPEDHLAWFSLDVVSQLDLSEIEDAIQSKDSRGQRPYLSPVQFEDQHARHPVKTAA